MIDHDDEREAREAVRKAFPVDAGLSAEKTRELYGSLRSVESDAPRRRWHAWAVAASVSAVLVVGLGAVAVYAARPAEAPLPAVVTPAEQLDVLPQGNGPVPAMALKAIAAVPAEVLHFTSAADTEFGPNAGHSTEEMWFDPKSGSGRLVRKDLQGDKVVLTTTIVSDGRAADVMTQRAGQVDVVIEPAGRKERRSFDKLSAYRNMLESDVCTVTARGMKDGVETYKLRAVVPGFGGSGFEMVMEAEVRATDYLPLSYSSTFRSEDGKKVLRLRSRTFSKFERVKTGDLPADWFKPKMGGPARDDGAPEEPLEI